MKVYGPYLDSSKTRRIVLLYYSDGTRKTMSNARYIIQELLGIELAKDDEIDHINGDSLDDRLENLQIIKRKDHHKKHARKTEWYDFICPACGKQSRKPMRQVKHNWKNGKVGPYCSRHCAGKIHN